MLTSQQVNALMAQQNAQFAMMQQQQGGMAYAPAVGVSQYPPSFNYGVRQAGIGDRASSIAFGGLSAAGTGVGLAGAGLGIASIFSSSPAIAAGATALDFTGISAGLTAAGAAGGLGTTAGFATFGAVAAPVAIAGAGLSLAGERFLEGRRSQAAVNRLYANEAFANSMSFSGRGFSRAQMMQIGSATRAIDESSPYISGADAQAVGQMFREMGIARGIQNVDVISAKLKEFGKVAETVAKQLGTSIRDVQGVLDQNRRMGFMSPQEITGNVVQMRVAEGMGMGREAFTGMQLSAVASTRGMGLTGKAGARSARGIANSILTGMQTSGITSEELKDLTNAASLEEAVAMIGTQQTQRMSQLLLRPGIGRALLAGTGTVGKGGRFTGGVDIGLMEQVASGEIGLNELQGMAAKNLSTSQGGMSFMANQKKLVSSALESEMANEALVGLARRIIKDEYGGNEDALTLVMDRLGIAEEQEQELFTKLYKDRDRRRVSLRTRIAQEMEVERRQAEKAQYYTLRGQFKRFSGTIRDSMGGIEELGAEASTNIATSMEDLETGIFKMFGYRPMTTSTLDRERAAIGLATGSSNFVNEAVTAGENPNMSRFRMISQLSQAGNLSQARNLLVTDAERRKVLDAYIEQLRGNSGLMGSIQRANTQIYGDTSATRREQETVKMLISQQFRNPGSPSGTGFSDVGERAYVESALGLGGEELARGDIERFYAGVSINTQSVAKSDALREEARRLVSGSVDSDFRLFFQEDAPRTKLFEKGVGADLYGKIRSAKDLEDFDRIVANRADDDVEAQTLLKTRFNLDSVTKEDVKTVRAVIDAIPGLGNSSYRQAKKGYQNLDKTALTSLFTSSEKLGMSRQGEASLQVMNAIAGNLSDAAFSQELSSANIDVTALTEALAQMQTAGSAGDKQKALQQGLYGIIEQARQKKFSGETSQAVSLAQGARYKNRLLSSTESDIAKYYEASVKPEFGQALTYDEFTKQFTQGFGDTLDESERQTLAMTLSAAATTKGLAFDTGSGTGGTRKSPVDNLAASTQNLYTSTKDLAETTNKLAERVTTELSAGTKQFSIPGTNYTVGYMGGSNE